MSRVYWLILLVCAVATTVDAGDERPKAWDTTIALIRRVVGKSPTDYLIAMTERVDVHCKKDDCVETRKVTRVFAACEPSGREAPSTIHVPANRGHAIQTTGSESEGVAEDSRKIGLYLPWGSPDLYMDVVGWPAEAENDVPFQDLIDAALPPAASASACRS